ncbi:DNA topoisomerase IV subunit A [Parasulfuritortus cantonensis]|uniref:DNA topoisomerase 4 subunit A n=1 Tax=Parasulfuritortus cantonensis TaxID=2528202 RepID=A0A4R1BAD6_9PROT|nr:DNA topoisomerase IV subunit A [Parasulfuritortus cantonensis]TCJ13909.1 DNA topoisomerase IV subunit A [Parasulfuritortus cantonensis]
MNHDDDSLDLFADLPPAPEPAGEQPPEPPADGGPLYSVDGDGGVPLHLFAERAYLTYAMSTVLDRALPFVEDGQKPVQRRILYAMRELGNRSDAPFKKSARIVGDVIGKFHPHGDSAVYEAAVRMAQDFTLRYPLIEGQGNFGSRDGDSPAAMRYTEVRLSKFAEDVLLAEIERGTVDFRENYDGTLKEPALLPARLPVLLLNGVSGIAVGMATEIAPHNLKEVAEACIALIQGGKDEAVYGAIPGPDFPGGGQIISAPEDIRKAYESGRGSLRVRARWAVEPLARGQYRIAITELPPGTSTAKVLSEIEELINPKPKTGKKSLSAEQQNLKNAVLAVLDTFRDDSDKAHPVRIVLEPRSRTVTADDMMTLLLANTSLEGNASLNMTMIGRDGRPQQKNLPQALREWCEFRMEVVERRLRFRFDEVARRIHILEGRMVAFLRIEEVIRVIREADAPKAELMAVFGLTEVQAEDILEIRLRQLARLEGIKIERELKDLQEERDSLQQLLDSEGARRRLIVREIREDMKKYGDARRTLIEAAEKVTAAMVDTVADEPVTVILSRNGFIRSRAGHGVDRALLTWKDGDGELAVIETRTVHPVILLDGAGRAYTVRPIDLPGGKGDGVPVSSLVELQGGGVRAMLSAAPETRVLMTTTAGVGFIGRIADMVSRLRAGKAYMAVDEGAELLPPSPVPESARFVAALADEPRLLVFPIEEMKELSGGKGVILIALDGAEKLLGAKACADCVTVFGIGRGDRPVDYQVCSETVDNYAGKRARKGKPLSVKFKRVLGVR